MLHYTTQHIRHTLYCGKYVSVSHLQTDHDRNTNGIGLNRLMSPSDCIGTYKHTQIQKEPWFVSKVWIEPATNSRLYWQNISQK